VFPTRKSIAPSQANEAGVSPGCYLPIKIIANLALLLPIVIRGHDNLVIDLHNSLI